MNDKEKTHCSGLETQGRPVLIRVPIPSQILHRKPAWQLLFGRSGVNILADTLVLQRIRRISAVQTKGVNTFIRDRLILLLRLLGLALRFHCRIFLHMIRIDGGRVTIRATRAIMASIDIFVCLMLLCGARQSAKIQWR